MIFFYVIFIFFFFLFSSKDLKIDKHWQVNGTHYQKTLEAWLQIMDSKQQEVLIILGKTYGEKQAMKRYVFWRLFFM